MKNTKYLLLLLLFAFSACTNEDDFSLPQPGGSADGVVTCRMRLSCDVTGYGGATRSGGHEWEDGDRLYIRFHGDGDMACGTALYSSLDGIWTLSYSGTITSGAGLCCEVYYFENATHKDDAPVELTAHSVIYECSDGTYSRAGDDLLLSARLSPKTGRVRFVSASEQQFTFGGMSHYTSFDPVSAEYTSSSSHLVLSTTRHGDEYSTGYIYGFYSDSVTHGLKLMTDAIYVRTFPSSMLLSGKSGYISLPSVSSNSDWSILEGSGGVLNGHEYVDLGLSVKWATCNVGAAIPEEYGGYYAWGETEEKSDYSWETYKWCNGSSYSMTKYCTDSNDGRVDNKTVLDPEDDVAHVKWGGSWRMPTSEELNELFSNKCTKQWTTLNGVTGYRVTGPNGNSIFLPAGGYCEGTEFFNRENGVALWSSELLSVLNYAAYYVGMFYYDDFYDVWSDYDMHRNIGSSVRPVCE